MSDQLKPKKLWVHFVAIGGTGMGAVAGLLKDLGHTVTGSDGPLYPPMSTFLEDKKISIKTYNKNNLLGSTWDIPMEHPNIVVIGNAISRGHVEADWVEILAKEGKLRKISFPEALGEFCIQDRESFVVAGTHGKSTTSSLLTWAMDVAGLAPSYFIGGIPGNYSVGCAVGKGNVFVAEGDEYDTAYWDKESKFLHYRPHWVLCTSIEFDHADIYKDLEHVERSFLKLVDKTKKGWVLIDKVSAPSAISAEKAAIKLKENNLKVFRYGESKDSEYCLLGWSTEALPWDNGLRGTCIKIKVANRGEWTLFTPMIGKHNALNILGVLAVLDASGNLKDKEYAQSFLKSFKGIKRRQEEVYSSSSLVVIDDFAHHPTAIDYTIEAIQQKYNKRLLAAFFEPRSATSARNVMAQEFMKCFDRADAVFLMPPTKTNVPEDQKLKIEEVVEGIQKRNPNKKIFVEKDLSKLQEDFQAWSNEIKGPVVALVMSNGSFGGLHQKLADSDKQKTSIKGQGTVEYLLLLLVVVTVVFGVFAKDFQNFFEDFTSRVGNSVSDVISQRTLGIPLSWFERSGLGKKTADSGNKSQNGDYDGDGVPDDSAEGLDGSGEAAGADGNGAINYGANNKRRGSGDGSNSDSNSRSQAGDRNSNRRRGSSGADGNSGGGFGGEFGSNNNSSDNANRDNQGGESAGDGAAGGGRRVGGESDQASGAEAIRRGRRLSSQEIKAEEEQQGYNLFVLLKFAAIAGILILVMGMFVNKKGNRTEE